MQTGVMRMMTTAPLLRALPLCFNFGGANELRRPLGVSIVGGLIVSQALTALHDAGRQPSPEVRFLALPARFVAPIFKARSGSEAEIQTTHLFGSDKT